MAPIRRATGLFLRLDGPLSSWESGCREGGWTVNNQPAGFSIKHQVHRQSPPILLP
jgi:hypothetical protein